MQIGRIAMLSSPDGSLTTTGRRTIASMSRIAICGWLITGVAMTVPYCPGLVIVNVPSRISSGFSSPVRARVARSRDPLGQLGDTQASARDHRDEQPLSAKRDGNSKVDRLVAHDVSAVEPGVQIRELGERSHRRARNDRQRRRAQPGARRLDCAEIDLDPRSDRRGGLERSLHVVADRAAHAGQRDRRRRHYCWRHHRAIGDV